jgi:hypothetical protein
MVSSIDDAEIDRRAVADQPASPGRIARPNP